MLPAPFRFAGDHLALELHDARVRFTTRRGGVSDGPFASLDLGRAADDADGRVDENRARLAADVGQPWGRFARGRQVHGGEVRTVTRTPRADDPWPEVDGHATALPGVPAVVFTADCLPVVVAAPGAVAVVHAGWRGLAAGIVAAGVRAVRALAAPAAPLSAALGPAIGPCCYEVGDDVRAVFAASGRTLDLPAIAARELRAEGVGEVHAAGLCTACHPELFFSHRRDDGVTGRQAGLAWLSP